MHRKRLVIASDDAHTRAWVRQGVSGLDVSAEECGLGELSTRLADGPMDVVILDGGRHPDELTHLVESASADGSEVRLLALVEPEALSGLRLPVRVPGDFMVRGGSSEELAARLRVLLWPGEEVSVQELVRVGELTLNLATYQAHLGGEPIDFTYLEYALFAFLVTHPNRAYSREMLLRRVWGSDYFGGARTVDVHVRRVRSKIGLELGHHLQTVRNVGYLWKS